MWKLFFSCFFLLLLTWRWFIEIFLYTYYLPFNTCSCKLWLIWYVTAFFLKGSEGSQEAQNAIQGYSAWEHVCRTEWISWQDRACCISADLSHVFFRFQLSFSLLARQHPADKQPTCMPGIKTLEHLHFGNIDRCWWLLLLHLDSDIGVESTCHQPM